jgi:hypothetical protein
MDCLLPWVWVRPNRLPSVHDEDLVFGQDGKTGSAGGEAFGSLSRQHSSPSTFMIRTLVGPLDDMALTTSPWLAR